MAHIHMGTLWLVKATLLGSVCASRYSRLPVVRNEIESLDVICNVDSINITVKFEHPFKGMMFAKDFSQECNTFGTLKTTVTLSLPTNGCGLRLTTNNTRNKDVFMQYSVTLAVQQDKHLRQIADQETRVSCHMSADEFAINSKSMVKETENNLKHDGNSRDGRMWQDETWKSQRDTNENNVNTRLSDVIQSAKAWMEIVPVETENTGGGSIQEKLQVGEPAKIIFKSTVPVGIGWKIVDCAAHNGLGDSSQKLLDGGGCPIDQQLMPDLLYGPLQKLAMTRYQEATAVFPAFKFPDRDRLHLTCTMLLCRGTCIEGDCNKTESLNHNDRAEKAITEAEKYNILDQIKIFNSVEVLAPIAPEYLRTNEYQEDSTFTFNGIPGDETLCMSYHKMAVAFCILGMVFLIAALIATGGILKSRRSSNALSAYTKSIFSSTSGTGSSYYGSKLLHDNSSFGFSSTKGLQYGRIL